MAGHNHGKLACMISIPIVFHPSSFFFFDMYSFLCRFSLISFFLRIYLSCLSISSISPPRARINTLSLPSFITRPFHTPFTPDKHTWSSDNAHVLETRPYGQRSERPSASGTVSTPRLTFLETRTRCSLSPPPRPPLLALPERSCPPYPSPCRTLLPLAA